MATKQSKDARLGQGLVSEEVAAYVEREIFPRYDTENGHGLRHIQDVIRRSLGFAERINRGEIKTTAADFANLPEALATGQVEYDMSYVVAAFHDLGRLKSDKLHHLVSAAYLLDDDFVTGYFDRDRLRVMADAVMDHRASNPLDPLTIYGRIVSSADRDTDCQYMLKRAYDYMRHKYQGEDEDAVIGHVYDKIYRKFVKDGGYSAKKMYFENPEYEAMLAEFQRIAATQELFKSELAKVMV